MWKEEYARVLTCAFLFSSFFTNICEFSKYPGDPIVYQAPCSSYAAVKLDVLIAPHGNRNSRVAALLTVGVDSAAHDDQGHSVFLTAFIRDGFPEIKEPDDYEVLVCY